MVEVTERISESAPAGSWLKRALDVVGAFALLLFFAPAAIALICAIRLSRAGPIFTREQTLGLNGKPFGRWRLHRAAGRQGAVDRLVWRAGLADLPSALNVIAGEMSLIGPEPHSPRRSGLIGKGRADYTTRFEARPGMIWPCGADGQPSLGADLDYVSQWTAFTDLKVAARYAVNGLLREEPGAD
uniref:Sugar transferase n=1 Tax=Caulobacter sp. (strain K31) TaxID=366602 RepID=B0SWD6_CAUSK